MRGVRCKGLSAGPTETERMRSRERCSEKERASRRTRRQSSREARKEDLLSVVLLPKSSQLQVLPLPRRSNPPSQSMPVLLPYASVLCGLGGRRWVGNTRASTPAGLVKSEDGVDFHDGAGGRAKCEVSARRREETESRERDRQVVSEENPGRDVDYVLRTVPEMGEKLGRARRGEPDEP